MIRRSWIICRRSCSTTLDEKSVKTCSVVEKYIKHRKFNIFGELPTYYLTHKRKRFKKLSTKCDQVFWLREDCSPLLQTCLDQCCQIQILIAARCDGKFG